MLAESDPVKLYESRIDQIVEFALECLKDPRLGRPSNKLSFIAFVTRECKLRFKMGYHDAYDLAETACDIAMRKLEIIE